MANYYFPPRSSAQPTTAIVLALVAAALSLVVKGFFQVQPNQLALEREFYQRGIDMTQAAYGIDGLEKTNFEAVTDVEPGQLRADAETTAPKNTW